MHSSFQIIANAQNQKYDGNQKIKDLIGRGITSCMGLAVDDEPANRHFVTRMTPHHRREGFSVLSDCWGPEEGFGVTSPPHCHWMLPHRTRTAITHHKPRVYETGKQRYTSAPRGLTFFTCFGGPLLSLCVRRPSSPINVACLIYNWYFGNNSFRYLKSS